MKNRVIAILGSILFAMLVTGGTEQGTIYLNWNIRLPFGSKLVYELDSGASFQGDGVRYHVFRYKSDTSLADCLDWQEPSADAAEDANSILDEIDVPEERRTNFSKCPFWYGQQADSTRIYIFWEKVTLYVVEYIM